MIPATAESLKQVVMFEHRADGTVSLMVDPRRSDILDPRLNFGSRQIEDERLLGFEGEAFNSLLRILSAITGCHFVQRDTNPHRSIWVRENR